jgi:gluconolactonase
MTLEHALSAGWRDHPRYPDPAVEILDERFAPYRIFNAAVERLYTGSRWAEGPVWFGDGRYLLWSDIPNDRILKWDEETAQVSIFRMAAAGSRAPSTTAASRCSWTAGRASA